ncbi:hypothetical protein RSAG8_01100, partial [Rhizoctonia solani AG-8 WAC10335]
MSPIRYAKVHITEVNRLLGRYCHDGNDLAANLRVGTEGVLIEERYQSTVNHWPSLLIIIAPVRWYLHAEMECHFWMRCMR